MSIAGEPTESGVLMDQGNPAAVLIFRIAGIETQKIY
jgi:hypothetical protein